MCSMCSKPFSFPKENEFHCAFCSRPHGSDEGTSVGGYAVCNECDFFADLAAESISVVEPAKGSTP